MAILIKVANFMMPLKLTLLHVMKTKFKNAQLVFIDGEAPARIKRSFEKNGQFHYEMRESGDVFPEDRISLLKN